MNEKRSDIEKSETAPDPEEVKKEEEKTMEELTTISQIVGGDFGMKVSKGKEGEGSYFNPPGNEIVFDPLTVRGDPDSAKYVAGHEGSHRAVSAGAKELGLTKAQEQEFFGNVGFRYMNNAVEDPAVNTWLKGRHPGFEPLVNKKYDKELKSDDPNHGMVSPEVARLADQMGKMPQFAQYGTEVIRDWHKGEISEKVDPAVKKALDRTIDDVRENIKNIPNPASHTRQEKTEAAQKRFEKNVNYLWPEVKKLVEKDLHNEELRNSANDYEKMEEEMEKMEQQGEQSGDSSEQQQERSEKQEQQSEESSGGQSGQSKESSEQKGQQSSSSSDGQQGSRSGQSEQQSENSSGGQSKQSGNQSKKQGQQSESSDSQSEEGEEQSDSSSSDGQQGSQSSSESGGQAGKPSSAPATADKPSSAKAMEGKEQIQKKLDETGRLPKELREELKKKMNEAKEKAEKTLKEEIEKKEKELADASGNKNGEEAGQSEDSQSEQGTETKTSGEKGSGGNKGEEKGEQESAESKSSSASATEGEEKEGSESGKEGKELANEQNRQQNGKDQSEEGAETESKNEPNEGEGSEKNFGENNEGEKSGESQEEGTGKSEGKKKEGEDASESGEKEEGEESKDSSSTKATAGDPSSAEATAGEEKPIDQALSEKIKKEIEKLKNELGKMQNGDKMKPLPLDELSEELKNELEKQLAKRPKEEREKYKENAKRAMEDFEDALNEELESKLGEDVPENHAERRERMEREAKSDKQMQNSASARSTEMTKKELNTNQIKAETLKVHLTQYEKMRKDVAPLADALYLRLVNHILKPEDYGNDETGYSTGLWPDFTKVMQADHSKDERSKLWFRETFPGKKDYYFAHLFDASGSMEGEKMAETIKGGIVVIEPIDRMQDLDPSKITVRQSVAAFHEGYFPIKSAEERMTKKIEKDFASIISLPKQDEGTNTFQALEITLAELLKNPGENGSFVLVYTDGAPNKDIQKKLKTLLKGGKAERKKLNIKIGIIWLGQTDDEEDMKAIKDEYGFDFGVAMTAVKPSEEDRREGKKNFAEKLGSLLESIVENPDKY